MNHRICISFLLGVLLVLPGSAPADNDAATKLRVLNNGRPVHVKIMDRTFDRSPELRPVQSTDLISAYKQPGKSKTQAAAGPLLELPLRRGLSNRNPGVFGISNFVDQNEAFPGSLLDWNCGERTYDTDGFNHNGTDYNAAQYPWLTMAQDGLVVVAAADGEIIDRRDGEFDQQCTFESGVEANFVVLRHSDGTITIYAHMKKGSVTPRQVGDMVEQGDYLGVVGSSGLSSGPHLHLGVQDISNNLYDPYAGSCNSLNVDSFWVDQESYSEKGVMSVATHSAPPEYPPCPQQEVPHFNNIFAGADVIYLSATVRDFEGTDTVEVQLRDPTDQVIWETSFMDGAIGHAPIFSAAWGFQLAQPAMAGKYRWSSTFADSTEVHDFYVDSGPAPDPMAVAANNAYTGLWYDPALDGEGFNIVTTTSGTIIYFYGSDSRGNRLWLISDLIPGEIEPGKAIEVLMYESTGGVFPTPVSSARGLSAWGVLTLLFSDCMNGQSTLSGLDGLKASLITKLAGVSGASCVDGGEQLDSDWAGLWYDPSKDGEGYNLIVSPLGRILYFYGFETGGLRLWLVSELIGETLTVGATLEFTMYEATQGTFDNPVPSGSALVTWGTAKITVVDCTTVTIVMTGSDGSKSSNTVRLAGIIGSTCVN